MERDHWLTLVGIVVLIVAVAGFGVNVGMAALVIAAALDAAANRRRAEGHSARCRGA